MELDEYTQWFIALSVLCSIITYGFHNTTGLNTNVDVHTSISREFSSFQSNYLFVYFLITGDYGTCLIKYGLFVNICKPKILIIYLSLYRVALLAYMRLSISWRLVTGAIFIRFIQIIWVFSSTDCIALRHWILVKWTYRNIHWISCRQVVSER